MTDDELVEYQEDLLDVKRGLTNNHTSNGTRASFAPCLGGLLHGIPQPIASRQFEETGMEYMFRGKPESVKDTYELKEIQISESETIKVYECVHRLTMSNSSKRKKGDEPYLNAASVDHLLWLFVQKYKKEYDKGL